jgi:hypothetical protein
MSDTRTLPASHDKMKFWELVSIFRTEKNKIEEVLREQHWTEFLKSFEIIDDLIKNQNRLVLDQEVPFELVKEICNRSELKFWLYFDNNEPILSSHKRSFDDKFELLRPIDIIERYNNGSLMEEALEFGTVKIGMASRQQKL